MSQPVPSGNGNRAALHALGRADVIWFAAYLVAVFLAFRYGTGFGQSALSIFWIPDVVMLCALLKSPPRYWWLFLLTALPFRLFSSIQATFPLDFVLRSYLIDGAKTVAAVLVLRRYLANPLRIQSIPEFLVFLAVVVVGIPVLSAFAGAWSRSLTFASPFWPIWEHWFLGDALGQLTMTPFVLYWVFDPSWLRWRPKPSEVLEVAILVAGLIATGWLAATTPAGDPYLETRSFLPVPFLFWAAIRFGMPGATGAIAIITLLALEAAFVGPGHFAHLKPLTTALALRDYLFLRAVPLYFVAIAIDQRRAAERAARASEVRFRTMAHSAPVMLWISGRDRRCTFFNKGWLDFTGRTLEELLGNGWAACIHPDDLRDCIAECIAAFDARRPFEVEFRIKRHDGEFRWVVDRGVPLYDENGEFEGYIGSAIDIEDRKRAEEIGRAAAYVQRLAVMGELTATIAHEVRQPLTAMQLDAHSAEKMLAMTTPPVSELLEIAVAMRRNVARVDAVISRIRGYLRKGECEIRPVDINAVVLDVLWLVAGDARKRNIRLGTDLDRSLPRVLGDRTQLAQVLLNLVVNGMDAMERMSETGRQLVLRTRLSGADEVEITVADCGCGIDPDEMAVLFDSVFTVQKQGIGLGLAVAKSIVAAHRGRIWAENNASGGATFHFTVPVAEARAPVRAAE